MRGGTAPDVVRDCPPYSPKERSPPEENRPTSARINLLVALLSLIWGSTWVVIKTGLEDLPPLTSAGVRFVLASAVMIAIAPRLQRAEGGEAPAAWIWVTVGTLNFGISYGIVYLSETVLPSGLVSVLWSVFPLLMAASGHWLLPSERLRARQWVGFVAGFAGVVLLFRTDVRSFGPEALPMALLLLLSPAISVVGQVVLKRFAEGSSSALMNRNAMCLGAAILLLAGFAREREAEMAWTGSAIFSIVYLALCGTVVTFSLYFWLLRYAPAHRLSLVAYLTPAIALTLGAVFGGEPITLYTLAGTATILLGVLLVVRK
jgi:drug/metabolite transporter (DMT)-like permease